MFLQNDTSTTAKQKWVFGKEIAVNWKINAFFPNISCPKLQELFIKFYRNKTKLALSNFESSELRNGTSAVRMVFVLFCNVFLGKKKNVIRKVMWKVKVSQCTCSVPQQYHNDLSLYQSFFNPLELFLESLSCSGFVRLFQVKGIHCREQSQKPQVWGRRNSLLPMQI